MVPQYIMLVFCLVDDCRGRHSVESADATATVDEIVTLETTTVRNTVYTNRQYALVQYGRAVRGCSQSETLFTHTGNML